MRYHRLAVEGNDARIVPGKFQREDAGIGGIDQAKANAFAGPYCESFGNLDRKSVV